MCTNPRHIINPTRFYYSGATKEKLIVPCGKCDECRAMKSQDWHLRIWSEVRRYNKLGGKCIYVSFTYRPECVPYFEWNDFDGHHKVPCFNQKDKNRFFNTMRKSQERLGYTGKDELPVRYIWCCEYGHDNEYIDSHGKKRKGTIAPHYHAILCFPPRLIELLGLPTDNRENPWKKYIQSFWPYGFCRWSKPLSKGGKGIFVNDEFAGQYTSKYITKDLDFYSHPELKKFLFKQDGKLDKKHIVKLKGKLPTHWQSLQFGSDLINDYDTPEKMINGVDFHLKGDLQKGKSRMSKCPKYIKRKTLYVHDKQNLRYVLSDFGVSVSVQEFQETLDDRVKKLTTYFNPAALSCHIKDFEIKDIFKDSNVHFDSVEQLCNELLKLKNKHLLTELYLYDTVWSGAFDDVTQFYDLDSLDFNSFYELSVEQYVLGLNKHFNPVDFYHEYGVFKKEHFLTYLGDREVKYYSTCNRFENFDEILMYIHMCDSFIRARTNKSYLKAREEKLALNHELSNYERRISERFGSGWHGAYIKGCESPEIRQRSHVIMERIKAKLAQ